VTARGPWGQPQLQARFGQPNNPLLGRWDALLDWSDQRLVLQRFNSAHLRASGVLPLALRNGKGLVPGQLDLSLELERYPLERLELLVGAQLQGMLQASGRVRGPLNALTPDLDLRVDQPGAGPLSLRENWQGQWFGDPAGGGRLRMEALAPAPVGMLNARIDSRWVPRQVRLERVVLAGVWTQGTVRDAERSLAELARLAETAGSEVLEGVIQRRDTPDPATYLGSGKARERAGI
jgi:translocation and assembly module TamB